MTERRNQGNAVQGGDQVTLAQGTVFFKKTTWLEAGLGKFEILHRSDWKMAEKVAGQFDQFPMLDVAGSGQQKIFRHIFRLVKSENRAAFQPGHLFSPAADGVAQGVVFINFFIKGLEGVAVGIIFGFPDFLDDDIFFLQKFLCGKNGIQHDIGEEVERCGQFFIDRFDIKLGDLFAGEGVQPAAQPIGHVGDLLHIVMFAALEKHVFDQMVDAVGCSAFGAAAAF